VNDSVQIKNIISGSFWGVLSKVIDSFAKFITIPLLISYYGKFDFGLIALAFSLNAYLRLMDFGMNTGAVRYFSLWFAQRDYGKILNLSQSGIFIYGIIGAVNAISFVVIGFYSSSLFHLENEQAHVFELMMYILAVSAVFSWIGYVIEQILTAFEEFGWLSKMLIVSSILSFVAVFVSIKLQLRLNQYFTLYVLSMLLPIPFNIVRLRKTKIPVRTLLNPKLHVNVFKEVAGYSLAVFAMGIFQVTADTIRPILLGSFSSGGIEVLADFRIAQTIALLVMALGGVFFNMLVPLSSKAFAINNETRKDTIIYTGTKFISAFLSLVIFGLIININYVLTIYVGPSYSSLAHWISIWLLTLLISMHTLPVSSIILSAGKTTPLVWSSAIGCVASIALTIWLAPIFNVGAAVIGYLAHVLIHNAFTYCYYIPLVLKLDAKRIFFRSFLPVAMIGASAAICSSLLSSWFEIGSDHLSMVVRSGIFLALFFLGAVLLFMGSKEILHIRKSLQGGGV